MRVLRVGIVVVGLPGLRCDVLALLYVCFGEAMLTLTSAAAMSMGRGGRLMEGSVLVFPLCLGSWGRNSG